MLDLSRGEGPLSALLGGRGLSATFLKILAVVFMTLDHVGLCFYWLPYASLFRQLGRIAFPLFAYTVGESIRHTRHPRRYFLCLLLPGIVMQTIYTGVMGSFDGNVFLTFVLSYLLVLLLRRQGWHRLWAVPLALLLVGGTVYVSYFLEPLLNSMGHLPGGTQMIMYETPGVLLPVAVAMLPNRPLRLSGFTLSLAGLCLVEQLLYRDVSQWYAMWALLPILFYSGGRGRFSLRWFFYLYYPLHLVVIYYLSTVMR